MTAMMVGGIGLGAVVAFVLGWFVRAQLGARRLRSSAEQRAHAVLEQAAREADSAKRDALLAGPRGSAPPEAGGRAREPRSPATTQLEAERAFQQKEAAFSRRVELIDKKERDLKKRASSELARARAARSSRSRSELDAARAGADREALAHRRAVARRGARAAHRLDRERGARRGRSAARPRSATPRSATPSARRARCIALAIQRYAGDHVSETSRVGGAPAERRHEGPHHRPRGPQHPLVRDHHRRRRDHRRHARGGDPLGLRSGAPRDRAPVARATGRRRPHPPGAHRGSGRQGEGGGRGQDPASSARWPASRSACTASTPSCRTCSAGCTTAPATARTSCATRSRSRTWPA